MDTPLLYRQLQDQLSQWVQPKDQRHLQGFVEIVAAVLQSGEACLGRWIPDLSHRNCGARAHMGRLSYFLHNPQITAERYYEPILGHLLSTFAGEAMLLTLDTSMLWDQFCLIEVCLAWGGRSFTLAQVVLEHGSAMVGFEQYRPVLERAQRVLPPDVQVTLLADRGGCSRSVSGGETRGIDALVEPTEVGLGDSGEVRPVGYHHRRSNSIGREPLPPPRTSLLGGAGAGVR